MTTPGGFGEPNETNPTGPDDPSDAAASHSRDEGTAAADPQHSDPQHSDAPRADSHDTSSSDSDATTDVSTDATTDTTTDATSVAPRRKHAAEESGLRLPAWMLAIGAAVVIGLVVWLIIGLSGDDEEASGPADDSVSATTTRSASPASLPSLLCTGPSYVLVDTGQSADEMLADVSATEAQFPDSRLSTVPGGCIPGSTAVDEVVLALGPFDTFEDACSDAQGLQGVSYQVYAGSADQGLVETTCP